MASVLEFFSNDFSDLIRRRSHRRFGAGEGGHVTPESTFQESSFRGPACLCDRYVNWIVGSNADVQPQTSGRGRGFCWRDTCRRNFLANDFCSIRKLAHRVSLDQARSLALLRHCSLVRS